MTTARQANLVHLTFGKRRTAALHLTEILRFFAKKHTRVQLFSVTIKLSVNICFQKLHPPFVFLLPPLMAAAGYGPGSGTSILSSSRSSLLIIALWTSVYEPLEWAHLRFRKSCPQIFVVLPEFRPSKNFLWKIVCHLCYPELKFWCIEEKHENVNLRAAPKWIREISSVESWFFVHHVIVLTSDGLTLSCIILKRIRSR